MNDDSLDPAEGLTLAAPAPSDLRDELTDMVVRDLLGPAGGPEEELNQKEHHVYQRYLVGMLAPKKQRSSRRRIR